jgi:hypothetical protein
MVIRTMNKGTTVNENRNLSDVRNFVFLKAIHVGGTKNRRSNEPIMIAKMISPFV